MGNKNCFFNIGDTSQVTYNDSQKYFQGLHQDFESIMAAMLCLHGNSLFTEENIMEKDLQQNLTEINMNESFNNNFSSNIF